MGTASGEGARYVKEATLLRTATLLPFHRRAILVFPLLMAGVAGACQSSIPVDGPVVIVGSWTGSERTALEDVLAEFEARSGEQVEYVETRDLDGVIEQRRGEGLPLDVAGVNGPQHLAELARAGALRPLSEAIDLAQYKADVAPTFVDLGSVDARLYGAFIKSSTKGLIWYNPRVFRRGTPATWDDLERLGGAAATDDTRLWCVGLASDETSGWPATDWIENVLIRQGGPDVYDAWVAGRHPWASAEITRAFQTYGQIVADDAVYGGREATLTTRFTAAGEPLFTDPPGCLFLQQGSFMVPFLAGPDRVAEEDFDFFAFPDMNSTFSGSVIGGGDLVVLLSTHPAARELMAFLVSVEGQSKWVSTGGGVLSINPRVTEYPTDIDRRAAALLVGARFFRFDGSDQMPTAMDDAFLAAVLDFTRDQRRLPDLLADLDEVRLSAY